MPPVHVERLGIAHYHLVRPLGDGGSATVFEAVDRRYQTRVAVKMLRQREGAALFRFKQEFRVLADLSHPNVVRFGEMFEDQGAFYLTMELVEGVDLLSWVRPGQDRERYNNVSATRTLDSTRDSGVRSVVASSTGQSVDPASPVDRFLRTDGLDTGRLSMALPQLCSGLIALHGVGLVHRDLKPDNILITQEGRLVLLDFGLATEWTRISSPELVGTTLYMAPEQLAGEPLTTAANWYAVGVILYEALTGQLPHPPEHAHDAAWKREHRPEPPTGDDSLCELCMQLLDPVAERRPTDADVARHLGLDLEVERGRASFRSRLQYVRDLFSGRRGELAWLRDIQRRAQLGGALVTCHITGESGVGKSALVGHFLEELRHASPELEILTGRCYERERVPYAGLDRVVDDLSRRLQERIGRGDSSVFIPRRASLLAQVFPVLRAIEAFNRPLARLSELDPFEARRLAFDALRELLAALGDERMLVVHIDDAQWLDAESAALLQHLITGAEPPHMLLLLTGRVAAAPAHEHVNTLLSAAPNVSHLHLGPLSPLESEQLAIELMNRLGGSSSEPALVALHSGGHPLFIHELVMHGATRSEPWALSLERALSSRLQALTPESRTLLEAIALCSSPVSHEVARSASSLSADAYPWALFALRAENLIAFSSLERGAEVRPYHDRIRELVVAEVRPDNRAQMHARLATSLEAHAPELLDALAQHCMHAGLRDKAAGFAREAAQRALGNLAFAQAAGLFRLALDAEQSAAIRTELEAGLGRSHASAGRGVEAAEAYLRAAGTSTEPHGLELRLRAGEQLLRSGRVERGFAVLSDVARVLKLRMPRHNAEYAWSVMRVYARIDLLGLGATSAPPTDVERLRLRLSWTLASSLSLINTQLSIHFLARTAELAVLCGDAEHALRSIGTLGAALSQNNAWRGAARRLLKRARAMAQRAPSPENQAWIDLLTGIAAIGEGDFIACEAVCSRAHAAFRDHCTGVAWEVVTSQAFTLWSMVYQGKFGKLTERLPAVLADARARDDRFALATLTIGPLHQVELARDQPQRARGQCREAMRDWTDDLCVFQRMCALHVEAHVDLYEGQPAQAWSTLSQHWPEFERSMMSGRLHRIEFLSLRARIALSRAEAEPDARKDWLLHAARDAERIAREDSGFARGQAACIDASCEFMRADPARACAQLDRAAGAFEREGIAYLAGLARLARANLSANHEDARKARGYVASLGVVNVPKFQRLWLPALPTE